MLRAALAVTLFTSLSAAGAERLDHRGSVGLLLSSGVDYRAQVLANAAQDQGARVPLELGGSVNLGNVQRELNLSARLELGAARPIVAATLGYRGYFGDEAWKTFFDLSLRSEFVPAFNLGPRIGFGVQFDPHPLFGVFAMLAAHVGAGNGIRFGGEALIGIQLRSYLLE